MKKNILVIPGCLICCYFLITLNFGCAQISAPTGGAKDTLPPRLLKAVPELNTVNFKGNKITLSFNEYIELQDLQGNLLISPLQKANPTTSATLKSITIKFKDSLIPNTTYSINFGNSIRDVHEGNVLKGFTYVFSTGNTIDSLTMEGNVIMAETGKADSTLMIMLYRNTADSAVLKTKPNYIARPDGNGHFKFNNLSNADFNIYALKDGDGGKTYNSKTEIFAFYDTTVNSLKNPDPIILYAYAEQKAGNTTINVLKTPAEKKLRYTDNLSANLSGKTQDLLETFNLFFNNPLKVFDTLKMSLTDTNYKRVSNYSLTIDSTRKTVSLSTTWLPESAYYIILAKDAVQDSSGNNLSRSDTIRFTSKKIADYGTVLLRFSNIDLAMHPVIQFMDGDNVKFSFPLVALEWNNKLFPPGDYTIRILYDLNNNGVWDPGNYSKKLQPEKAIQLPQKLGIRADWDNERDIKL
ncbi:MAG: Ig-like domain-containing protein [Ferruginibacter sp.]